MKALLDPESSFSQNPRLSSSDTLVVGALPFMQEWMAHKESSVQSLDGLISKTRSKINTQKQHEREKGLQGRIQSFSSFRAACNEQVSGFFEAEKEESFSSNSPSKHQISSIFDSLGEDAEISYQIGDYEKAEFSKREEDFHSSLAAVSDAQEKLLTSANLFEALVNSVAIYTASQQFESAQVQLTLATPIHSLISGAQKVHTTYGPTRITAEEFQAAGYPVTSLCLSDPFVAFDHFTHTETLSSTIPVNVKQAILTGGSISLGFGAGIVPSARKTFSGARLSSEAVGSEVLLYNASKLKTERVLEIPLEVNQTARGGAYGRLETLPNFERHHMPADSVTSIPYRKGPAIQMQFADHFRTSSYGNKTTAKTYREEIQTLIEMGNIRGAMAREIRDVRRVANSKYTVASRKIQDPPFEMTFL
ncbi:MAG TPA: hypothetical protein PLY23_09240, partial [Alphaproteobacteria bacterium]|nr:hypothetical protein [Alphaproteobacteria bacterium]